MCIRTIPYGYVVESGAKVIVADEATVITEVFERYCSGETFKQIADSLTCLHTMLEICAHSGGLPIRYKVII